MPILDLADTRAKRRPRLSCFRIFEIRVTDLYGIDRLSNTPKCVFEHPVTSRHPAHTMLKIAICLSLFFIKLLVFDVIILNEINLLLNVLFCINFFEACFVSPICAEFPQSATIKGKEVSHGK